VERTSRFYPRAELAQPYGRGINLSIDVEDLETVHAAVTQAGHKLFLPVEERWYDREDDAIGVRQFAVQDPDGYLLRLTQNIGTRHDASPRTACGDDSDRVVASWASRSRCRKRIVLRCRVWGWLS